MQNGCDVHAEKHRKVLGGNERNKDTCGNLTAVCKVTCILNTISVESKDVVLALSHVKDAVDRGVQ